MSTSSTWTDQFDDPFAEGTYEPCLEFALQARTQLRERFSELTALAAHHEQQSLGGDGIIARSAKKTVYRFLERLQALSESVDRAVDRGLSTNPDSQAHQMAVSEAIEALHKSLPIFDEGTLWAQHVGSLAGPAMTIAPQVISTLEEPRAASAQLLKDLQGWLRERLEARDGSLVLLHTTPGVGKTHQMLRAASHLQMAEKRRIIFAARTKEMILPPRGELLTRAIATHPLARGYACRAGTTGATWLGGNSATELNRIAWYAENSGKQTQPVKGKESNPWGLYDMLGNMWEWCSDYKAKYVSQRAADPAGPATGSLRVYRGGSWGGDAGSARAARRVALDPGLRNVFLGFRLARGQ